jgi:hypothetical protein
MLFILGYFWLPFATISADPPSSLIFGMRYIICHLGISEECDGVAV